MKSVAALRKALENSKLIQSSRKAHEMLRAKVRRNTGQKFGKSESQLCPFPVNQALWGICHEFLCVCNSAPKQEHRSFHRIVQNLEVQKIQKVCDTAQARISNLRLQDEETHGPSEEVHWGRRSLENIFVA